MRLFQSIARKRFFGSSGGFQAAKAALAVVTRIAGHPPDRHLAAQQRSGLGNVIDAHRDPVIPTGTHRRIDVYQRAPRNESQPRRLPNGRLQVEYRGERFKVAAASRFGESRSTSREPSGSRTEASLQASIGELR